MNGQNNYEQPNFMVMCQDILKATASNEKFNPNFINSLLKQLQEGKMLSEKQVSSLYKVHKSYVHNNNMQQ